MTYEIGDKKKPTIVLIHGYGGSGMIFFRIFKHLADNYHVYAIDLLGMGRSSRPRFLPRSKDEADNFFVQSIEKWREAMDLKNLTIVAHSFGGYVASRYSLMHYDMVKKLILWSPHGCESKPDDYEALLKKRMKENCKFRWLLRSMLCIFKYQCRADKCLKMCGR